MAEEQLQKRACRACGKSYDYPVKGSVATRYFCERCFRIEDEPLEVFRLFRMELNRMDKRIQSLEKELASLKQPAGADESEGES